MKIFFGEFKAKYENYLFPYQVWLLKEENDLIEPIYDRGFLPFRNLKNVYYLSRNLRVNLDNFELSSENRRILSKTSEIESDLVSLADFKYSPEVQKLCVDYSRARFGAGVFSTGDIKNIFNHGIYNQVFIFKNIKEAGEVGYAVCFVSQNIVQYAHSFYDLDYLNQNLGARMMLEAVVWAKQSSKRYIYLGTCYQKQALYKTEFKGVEFFNGFRWTSDLSELKKLILGFEEEEYLLKNKKFIDQFYPDGLESVLRKYGVGVNF